MVNDKPAYDFPVNSAKKIYSIDFGGAAGFFLLGDRVSIYLRDY
jgi:hypothetical protein